MDGVGVLVGDLDAELLLNGHDDLDGVQAVEAEVVGEVGSGLDLCKGKNAYQLCVLKLPLDPIGSVLTGGGGGDGDGGGRGNVRWQGR